ncbi:hypothetical protein ARMGADRAFT_1035978 [Armillaria gallica]|uniref:Uncharacterized protein n=1 Tax=Armillaria gallica TaxID=47427 RepID=A0A2H3DEU7_ARMGA|nr:hypothetical protein ARMGADRAFT_1035978 [Armillaria gallica]
MCLFVSDSQSIFQSHFSSTHDYTFFRNQLLRIMIHTLNKSVHPPAMLPWKFDPDVFKAIAFQVFSKGILEAYKVFQEQDDDKYSIEKYNFHWYPLPDDKEHLKRDMKEIVRILDECLKAATNLKNDINQPSTSSNPHILEILRGILRNLNSNSKMEEMDMYPTTSQYEPHVLRRLLQ